MDSDLWPLAALRLQTPLLELRPPSDRDLADLARVAAAGVHDPQSQPFAVPWTDAASLTVSGKLGYLDDGIDQYVSRGRPATVRRLRLDRRTWQATRRTPVSIEGLEACLAMFGLASADAASG
ncbi:MAG: hypothetical protein WBH47_25705 [Streptosporangiaceae bacterium]